jgi:hypothetical protein
MPDRRTPQTAALQIGDWGREGNENQRRAAALMARVAACMPPKFVISTGDNFYPRGWPQALAAALLLRAAQAQRSCPQLSGSCSALAAGSSGPGCCSRGGSARGASAAPAAPATLQTA